jgi:hypothetical protein
MLEKIEDKKTEGKGNRGKGKQDTGQISVAEGETAVAT